MPENTTKPNQTKLMVISLSVPHYLFLSLIFYTSLFLFLYACEIERDILCKNPM